MVWMNAKSQSRGWGRLREKEQVEALGSGVEAGLGSSPLSLW